MAIKTTEQSFTPDAILVVNRFTNVAVTQSVKDDHDAQASGDAPVATIEAIGYDAHNGTTNKIVSYLFAGQVAPNFMSGEPVVLLGRRVDGWFEAVGMFEQTTGAAPTF